MTYREAIERLSNLYRVVVSGLGEYNADVRHNMAIDLAIEALKAQEPRVMTVEEVGKWVLIKRVGREPIFIEVKDSISAWIVSDEYWDIPLNVNLCSESYGIIWRCWTSRPDDKTRSDTPWE